MSPPSGTLLDAFAGRDDAPALLSTKPGSTLSHGGLKSLVVQTANTLIATGIRPGDVVTIADANTVIAPLLT